MGKYLFVKRDDPNCELLGNRITELPASFITALNRMEQRLT